MSATETTRETVKSGSVEGYDFEIIRTNEDKWAGGTCYQYEFVLFVGGEPVTTAGNIEMQGWTHPWPDALKRYAQVYCATPEGGDR